VGRRHELAEARRLLASARLVSLVGPGGAVGGSKTVRISRGPESGDSFLVVDGVLTRTVIDTAAAIDVLAGYEAGDATWAPGGVLDERAGRTTPTTWCCAPDALPSTRRAPDRENRAGRRRTIVSGVVTV